MPYWPKTLHCLRCDLIREKELERDDDGSRMKRIQWVYLPSCLLSALFLYMTIMCVCGESISKQYAKVSKLKLPGAYLPSDRVHWKQINCTIQKTWADFTVTGSTALF